MIHPLSPRILFAVSVFATADARNPDLQDLDDVVTPPPIDSPVEDIIFERVLCDLTGQIEGLTGAVFRYEVLERLKRAADRRDVTVIAFGFTDTELRLVLEGESENIRNVLRGVKVGTTRAAKKWKIRLASGPSQRTVLERSEVVDAVVWAHLGPVNAGAEGPLSNPWSSHRDMMCFRDASFFDASRLLEIVDPRVVHALAGGTTLPMGWPPVGGGIKDLSFLLRVAGGVLGVLPADRRCFRLFVHLALAQGWNTADLGPALALSHRRIRQLAVGEEPRLGHALHAVADWRLGLVP